MSYFQILPFQFHRVHHVLVWSRSQIVLVTNNLGNSQIPHIRLNHRGMLIKLSVVTSLSPKWANREFNKFMLVI
jgi:hypothetical protein